MSQQHPVFSRAAVRCAALCVALACGGGTGGVHAQTAPAPPPDTQPAAALRPGEPVTLNFTGADIAAVARAMATLTGRNVVVDPRVKGQMTLLGDTPLSPEQAWQQFLAVLRLQGFTVVESAGLHKLVPEADAKILAEQGSVEHVGAGAAGGQIMTRIFRLNYENAANLVAVLRPLISPNNTINVNPGNNALVITDYAENLQRLARIVASLDVASATDVEVIALRHAIASDMVALVSRLLEGEGSAGGGVAMPRPAGVTAGAAASAAGQRGNAFKTTLIAEPRSNSVILRAANAARLAQARSLIAQLDQPPAQEDDGASAGAQGNIHVVHLKNADAVALATTLRAAIAAQPMVDGSGFGAGGSSAAAATAGGQGASASTASNAASAGAAGLGSGVSQSAGGALGAARQPSTGGLIQADPSTNSLVITAPPPLFRQLRAVIDRLDGRRAQVLIESLIVEVNDNRLAQFGVQWQAILSHNGRVLGSVGTNANVAGANILSLLGLLGGEDGDNPSISPDALSRLQGSHIGLTQRVNGRDTLGALASFLQSSGDANILSTPHLMTLDNEEARIVVGQNVPLVTGSYANGAGSATLNPFTTVERQDVGLMLRVRPQINENGTVKLSVFQEVSTVDESTRQDPNGLTTNKRSIESNVLVEDGNIVVLGGLLDDNYAQAQERVPLLGEIPVLGHLFSSTSRRRSKTNLMVFLRPVIVRDALETGQLSGERYASIRALQQSAQPEANALLRAVSAAPVLPALPSLDHDSFFSPARILHLPGLGRPVPAAGEF